MKTVVSENEVAHLWANKIQDHARKAGNGNFYFDGDTIYSYGRHFPIATHYNDVVLFTTRTYSSTTSGHISTVRQASSHLKKVYCHDPLNAAKGFHHENGEAWFMETDNQFVKLRKAKKPELYLAVIGQQIDQLEQYMELFPKVKLTKEQRSMLTLIDSNKDNIKEAVKIKDEAILKAQQATLRKNAAAWKKFLPLWRNGIEDTMSDAEKIAVREYAKVSHYGTLLRVLTEKGKEIINTSLGINIPMDVAHRFYKKYVNVVKKGGSEGESCKEWEILGYKVLSATAELLVVGCHRIPKAEIDALVTKLNW